MGLVNVEQATKDFEQRLKDGVGKLENAFTKPNTTKVEVVTILKDFLPNFEHEEKGKSLDSKM